jgi:HrpA-like RNA helicase
LFHPKDQQHVFQAPELGVCHFVLASNVAESSLTLPNVCAVIDLGMNKQQVGGGDERGGWGSCRLWKLQLG